MKSKIQERRNTWPKTGHATQPMDYTPVKVVCLAALSSLLFCHCSAIPQTIAVEGELSSPETSLPTYEYPFDESGRYREDWAAPRSKSEASARPRRSATSVQTEAVRTSLPVPPPVSDRVSSPSLKPAPAPAVLASNSTGSRQEYHTVTRGDTLWSISRQYGVSVAELKAENGITADTIQSGTTIRLP